MSEKWYKIEPIVRRISGIMGLIFFVLLLGKAGASDCGAPIEDIFPSSLIYCGGMLISILIYKVAGGK